MTPAVTRLLALGVAHQLVSYDHDPGAASYGTEAADALGLDPATVFKTLLAQLSGSPPRLVVAVVPVTTQLDLKSLARAAGAKKAKMADPDVAERATGYVVGGISPIGQKTSLETYIDNSAMALECIHVSGGRRGLEIALAPVDLVTVTEGRVHPLSGQASL